MATRMSLPSGETATSPSPLVAIVGTSWSTGTDFLPNLAVNSLAFDPNDSRVIYAGTGEGYFREEIRGTRLPLRGDGIFVTHDAGESWTQLPSTAASEDFHWVNDVIMSPRDPHRLSCLAELRLGGQHILVGYTYLLF